MRNDDTGEWFYQSYADDPTADSQDPNTFGLPPGTQAFGNNQNQYITPGGSVVTTNNDGQVLSYVAPAPTSTAGYEIKTGDYGDKYIEVPAYSGEESAYAQWAAPSLTNAYLVNADGSVGPRWDGSFSGGSRQGVQLNAPKAADSGGLSGFLRENGWMVPLALITAGAATGLAGGAVAAEGVGGAAGGTGLTAGAGGSTGLLAGGTTAGLTVPTGAGIAVDSAIASGAGAGIGGTGAAAGGLGAVGGLNAALPAAGSVGGAGAGLSAELAPGAMLGTGLNGGAVGGSYLAGANGMVATDMFGNAIPASSVGLNGSASTGTSLTDALKTANQVRQGVGTANSISKLLSGGTTGTAATTGTSAQQLAQYLKGMSSPVQTNDFLGQYKMNQNPFLFNTPGQTTTSEGMYDVSGMANALRKA